MIINNNSLDSFMEKIAVSAGAVMRAMSGRLSRTIANSPVKTQFIESTLPNVRPEFRATQALRQQAATVSKAAPKGSNMSIGDYKTRVASHESGYPLGKAPVASETVATPEQKPGVVKKGFKTLSLGAGLVGASLVGAGVQNFASNPYAGTAEY